MAELPGSVAQRLAEVRSTIPEGVTLVAVSKFQPVEAIEEAFRCGQRHFGESRAQELSAKAAILPADIKWHFIGHLQRNKVRQVVACAAMIESIDSLELLRLIDKEAARVGRRIDVLLELHVAAEASKSGMTIEECDRTVESIATEPLTNVTVRGVMGMATFTDDTERITSDFTQIATQFYRLKTGVFARQKSFDTISMGMSDDYPIALSCGSNMVRIGTAIFGSR